MNLGTKLVGSFMVMIALLVVIGAVSFFSLKGLKEDADNINFSAEYDDAIMSTIISAVKMQNMLTDFSLMNETEGDADIQELKAEFDERVDRLKGMATSAEERQNISKLEVTYADSRRLAPDGVKLRWAE